MKKAVLSLMLLAILPALAFSQDVIFPDSGVEPGDWCQILVNGLTDKQLELATVDYYPKKDVQVIAAKTWGGMAMILFKVPKKDYAAEYPLWIIWPISDTSFGYLTGTIEVEGSVNPPVPPDPPNPPYPPLPPVTHEYQIMFFRDGQEVSGLSLEQLKMLNSSDFRKELEDKGHYVHGIEDVSSVVTGTWKKQIACIDGRCKQVPMAPDDIKDWYEKVKGKTLPHVVVALREGGDKYWDFDLPKTEEEFYAELEKCQ